MPDNNTSNTNTMQALLRDIRVDLAQAREELNEILLKLPDEDDEEKRILEEEADALREEINALEEDIKELEQKP